ncbi:MAG: putative inorganic carbon transporter subunit DabA [bacterium]
MSSQSTTDSTIDKVREILIPQGPLKEFVAQNPLKGFLGLEFHDAIRKAALTWGAWSYLPLSFYRNEYANGDILESALERSLQWNIADEAARERTRADLFEYPEGSSRKPRPLAEKGLRAQWTHLYGTNVLDRSSSVLYRLLGAYLDQGISIWRMPTSATGFLNSVSELTSQSRLAFPPFNQPIARELLSCPIDTLIEMALGRLTGHQSFHERYITDILLTTPGWSSTIDFLERNPGILAQKKAVTLKELVAVALVLDCAFIQSNAGPDFRNLKSLGARQEEFPLRKHQTIPRIDYIKLIWHEAWEWTFYERNLALLGKTRSLNKRQPHVDVQALFCIDDRESSLRAYLEDENQNIETFGLPGFFGIDFMYQCASDVAPSRLAPIVMKPKHLVTANYLNEHRPSKIRRSEHLAMGHHSHSIFRGWIITQVLGLNAVFKLALSIFKPTVTQATASSLSRVNENISMDLDRKPDAGITPDGYLLGFTPWEMAEKIFKQLSAIGLTTSFAPLVVLMAHGSSSTNNTHFSAYDCGACSGKPGTPNARAFAKMANRDDVRKILSEMGLMIPKSTQFVAALHDTTRDEVKFFDLRDVSEETRSRIATFKRDLLRALERNAKERCRRFELFDQKIKGPDALREVRKRSVAIFEPRPELTHTGNAVAIVGRRSLTKSAFLDRRAFLHSYDPTLDKDGKYLRDVLAAVIPVCGGINLTYYFSKLDNEIYGSSSKLPHNIIGLLGVCSGVEGDILTGLPRQMIELHDPVRLQLIIEHKLEVVQDLFNSEPALNIWVKNNWIRLMCIDPDDGNVWIYQSGDFKPLDKSQLPDVPEKSTYLECFEGSSQNCIPSIVRSGVKHGT